MKVRQILVIGLACLVAACAPIQQEPPVTENFIFVPPTASPPTKNNMSIAILLPASKSAFFETHRSDLRPIVADFLAAAQVDLEKMIIAKGFTTSGSYQSFDDMTFSQKERSSLVLTPEISLEISTVQGMFGSASTSSVTGTVVLQLLEPMSKEKVWIKRIELPPITMNVTLAPLTGPNGTFATNPDGSMAFGLTPNSTKALLNSFYASAFGKIWSQFDPREIAFLKVDADRLKGKASYRAN